MGKGHQKPLKTSRMESQSGWDPHKFVLLPRKQRRRRRLKLLTSPSEDEAKWYRGGFILGSYPHIHRPNN